MLTGTDVREIVIGIEERGGLKDVDVVLSGYLGGNDIGDAVLDAVSRVKMHSPDAIYACDPVMGSLETGCVVSPAMHNLFRDQIVQQADLMTPNHFELGFLTGTEPDTMESTLHSVDLLRAAGPTTVLVTSLERPEAPDDVVEMLAASKDGAWLVHTPKLDFHETGSGDVTAALFSAHFSRTGDAAASLAAATASIFDLLESTVNLGGGELKLVESQEAFVAPRRHFEVQRVR